MENNQGSVSERVWNAAEQAGAERRKRIDTTINRVLGLPEAAGKLAEIGSDAVKAKAEEIKGKAIDLKERTERKITETKDRVVERYETTRDNLISRVEAFKKKTVDKATELKNRAVKAGIETGLKIEDKIVAICELPAKVRESMAGRYERKAVGQEGERVRTVAEQFAERNGLDEMQRQALADFLAEQKMERGAMEDEHLDAIDAVDLAIQEARVKSEDHKEKAAVVRAKVEARRVFKGLLAKIK